MKKKNPLPTVIMLLFFLTGLSLLLYPSISEYWNSFHQTRAIAGYEEKVAQLGENESLEMFENAREYNQQLLTKQHPHFLSKEEKETYESLLNPRGTGIMGHIEIPTLDVSLPIYHGTKEEILQVAVGHLEWTSLPVGGQSTHCVLSGHRGLPSAKLFTELDKLVKGDTFLLKILDQILLYEVDQIQIVEPHETQALAITEGKEYCTLVTCTPYGVNSHRLLVRGHRVYEQQTAGIARVTADAVQIEPVLVAFVLAIPALTVLVVGMIICDGRKVRSTVILRELKMRGDQNV